MIYSLNGKLILQQENIAVIECMGVGYQCNVSNNTQADLPKIGENATLYTHMNIKDDAIDLYGFSTQDELSCFRMLISISGVGAKVALAILSTHSPDKIALAVEGSDDKMLAMAPGVGKKTAQRIVLELKDKMSFLAKTSLENKGNNVSIGANNAVSNVSQAINALTVLGYSSSQILPIVTKFDSNNRTEDLIRMTLKELGGK